MTKSSRRKQKASKSKNSADTTPQETEPDNTNVEELKSANPDPRSWLYKLVAEHNLLHSLTTTPPTIQYKLDLITEVILAQNLLRAFYIAMKDPDERAKCCGKVDGTTPSGLGGRTGLVKNPFIIATLLDAVTDFVRGFARELRDGQIEGWGVVDDDMKGAIERWLGKETAREWAVREGLVDVVDGEGEVEGS